MSAQEINELNSDPANSPLTHPDDHTRIANGLKYLLAEVEAIKSRLTALETPPGA